MIYPQFGAEWERQTVLHTHLELFSLFRLFWWYEQTNAETILSE